MTDYYAVDDEHAIYLARQSVKNLNKIKNPQVSITAPKEPLYDPEELYGIVGDNLKKVRCMSCKISLSSVSEYIL